MYKYCAYCLHCKETQTEKAGVISFIYRCIKTGAPVDIQGCCGLWEKFIDKTDTDRLIEAAIEAASNLEIADNLLLGITDKSDDADLNVAEGLIEDATIHLNKYIRKLQMEAKDD
jgi:hypothetical protein